MVEQNKKYCAFVSYSHADNVQSGRQWATWLHQSIETYEIPEDLVGEMNNRGEGIPSRIYPVFRDEEALPADSDLTRMIKKALDDSQFLIVICSPNSRKSKSVADEIRYFKELGRSDKILTVIIDGEPNASMPKAEDRKEFAEEDECFPKPLQLKENEKRDQIKEPLAADFRVALDNKKQEGWTSPQALRDYLNEKGSLKKEEIEIIATDYEKRLNLMLLKIISGLIGVPLDDLSQRDKAYQLAIERQKAKRLRQWLSGLAVLAIFAIIAGMLAWQQKQLANNNEKKALEERDKVLISQSRFLLDEAGRANDKGQHDLALLLGLNAMPGLYGGSRPMPNSLSELRRAVHSVNQQVTIQENEEVHEAEFYSSGNEFYVVADSPELKIYRSDDGQLVDIFHHSQEVKKAAFSKDNGLLATSDNERYLTVWYKTTKKQKYQLKIPAVSNFLTFSHDNNTLFSASTLGHLQAWDMGSGKVRFLVKNSEYSLDYLCVSKDNEKVLGKNNFLNQIYIWSTNSGELLHTINGGIGIQPFSRQPRFTNDCNRVVYYNNSGTFIYDLEKKESREISQQVHTIFSNSGSKFVALPASVDIQGEAEEVLRTKSFRKKPMLWDFKTEKGFSLDHFGDVSDAFFAPDDKYLVTVVYKQLTFWNPATGLKSHSIQLPENASDARFSANSQRIISHFRDKGIVGVWRVAPPCTETLFDVDYNQYGAKLSPQGRYAYLPAQKKGEKSVIVSTNDPQKTIVLPKICDIPRSVSFSDDENRVCINCFKNSRTRVIDLSNESVLYKMDRVNNTNRSLISPNGKYLVSDLATYEVNDVLIINIEKPGSEPIMVDLGIRRSVWEIRFSKDSSLIAARYGKTKVFFVDSDSGELVNSFQADKEFELFEFGRDNQSFYIHYSDNRTIEYSMLDNTPKLTILNVEDLDQIISVPKYDLLLLVSKKGDIGFWSSITGKFLERIAVGAKSVRYRLSPDQRYLYINSPSAAVISTKDRGVFYQSSGYEEVDIAIDEISNDIVLLSNRGVRRLPTLRYNILEKVVEKLSPSRRCLTELERERYFLPRLTEDEKQERQCVN